VTAISEEVLAHLAEVVHRHLGLHFPREKWRDLERGVEATCRELGESGVEACARHLASSLSRQQMEILGRNLTIGETYFFREEQAFLALEKEFLPPLLDRRRHQGNSLRLWSAACATGEEPYSLAILLRRLLPDVDNWHLTILATDINSAFLHKAEQGLYGNWSFRNDPGALREKWFTRTEQGLYRLRPEVGTMVTFAYHNLAKDPYPSLANNTNAMDVIFCRNVLMYFSPEVRQRVMDNLQRCLVEGGILVTGAAETLLRPGPHLRTMARPNLVVYQKQTSAPAREPLAPHPMMPVLPKRPPAPAAQTPARLDAAQLAAAYRRGEYIAICRSSAGLRESDADFADTGLVVARACANTGHLDDALRWVDTVLKLRRLNPEAHYLRAMILLEQGKTAEGLDALRTTLYLDHDFIPAYVAKGNVFRAEGNRHQADRLFRNALVLLEVFGDDDPVPHAEDMRAGRLREAVIAAMEGGDGVAKDG
jgi:chemotaxis protein methyltransferase CheR